MPKIKGYEVLRELVADYKMREVKIAIKAFPDLRLCGVAGKLYVCPRAGRGIRKAPYKRGVEEATSMIAENLGYGVYVRHTGFNTASYKNPVMPDAPEDSPITALGVCEHCGEEFYDGDEMYSCGGKHIHAECAHGWITNLIEHEVMRKLGFELETAGGDRF